MMMTALLPNLYSLKQMLTGPLDLSWRLLRSVGGNGYRGTLEGISSSSVSVNGDFSPVRTQPGRFI